MKTYERAGSQLIIRFDFDWDILNIVKTIPGRRFHNVGTKYWTCPSTPTAIRILENAGFVLQDEQLPAAPIAKVTLPKITPINVRNLHKTLFPFQQEGVGFVEMKNGRALLAHEMGLGKTIIALAWMALHPEKKPVVVVCPAHLKLNWEREIRNTLVDVPDVQVLFGTNPTVPITGDVLIINYDILHQGWVSPILSKKPQVLIVDEAHFCKTTTTLRTKATRKLASKIPHVLALTGTPIVNRPIEGYSIIQMLDRSLFPNYWEYAHRFCGAKKTWFGWDVKGATNKEELNQTLSSTIMLRRTKQDVLQDLPDKLRSFVPIELSNLAEYEEAETDFIEFIKRTRGRDAAERAKAAEYLTKIEVLKQIAVKGKMRQAIQWIADYLDSNGKLVVFANHKSVIQRLVAAFRERCVKVDGSVPVHERDQAVQLFQGSKEIKLFVGNIQAAGTGITLTEASSVAFLELPWTSGELSQAEDRCHRIGQKNAVNIYYLLAAGTIEERIATLLDSKRKILSTILDGKEAENTELLTELITSYIQNVKGDLDAGERSQPSAQNNMELHTQS